MLKWALGNRNLHKKFNYDYGWIQCCLVVLRQKNQLNETHSLNLLHFLSRSKASTALSCVCVHMCACVSTNASLIFVCVLPSSLCAHVCGCDGYNQLSAPILTIIVLLSVYFRNAPTHQLNDLHGSCCFPIHDTSLDIGHYHSGLALSQKTQGRLDKLLDSIFAFNAVASIYNFLCLIATETSLAKEHARNGAAGCQSCRPQC